MAGLVSYASSDEEEELQQVAQPKQTSPEPKPFASTLPALNTTAPEPSIGPVLGPAFGPALGPPLEPLHDDPTPSPLPPLAPPGSPYTSARALIHDLTLPPAPNTAIPASPPGSPPRAVERKLEQFLELKQRGVHFNARLAGSTAARNPALMDKLLRFVGVEGREQYCSALPPELFDPVAGLPVWAHRGPLREMQDKMRKEGEARRAPGMRTAVEFVPSSGPA